MYPVPEIVASHRFARLAPKLADKTYRDSYVSSQLRTWLADQVRALRGGMSQKEFGQLIGKPQTVVSRLEDPDYGRLTIETLLDVASKLDIALLVRFVDHPTFLVATNDFSDTALRPAPYNQQTINNVAFYYTVPYTTFTNSLAVNQQVGHASSPHHGSMQPISMGVTSGVAASGVSGIEAKTAPAITRRNYRDEGLRDAG